MSLLQDIEGFKGTPGELVDAIKVAHIELAALIPDPENPVWSDWPCENTADQGCLQRAYTTLSRALGKDQ